MNLSQSMNTRKENVETICDCIFSNQDVKNIESNLVKEVAYYLEDERCAVVTWR